MCVTRRYGEERLGNWQRKVHQWSAQAEWRMVCHWGDVHQGFIVVLVAGPHCMVWNIELQPSMTPAHFITRSALLCLIHHWMWWLLLCLLDDCDCNSIAARVVQTGSKVQCFLVTSLFAIFWHNLWNCNEFCIFHLVTLIKISGE